jgi:hypothetical protein
MSSTESSSFTTSKVDVVGTITGDGVFIHTDADQGATAVGEAFNGDQFDSDICTNGGGDNGCGGNTWFHGTDTRTNVTGWVSSCFVSGLSCP